MGASYVASGNVRPASGPILPYLGLGGGGGGGGGGPSGSQKRLSNRN